MSEEENRKIRGCEDIVNVLEERIERIEQNFNYARFDIQTQRIEELEKKVDSLDMEKKLKLDYMLKMNQLVENDKSHQACHEKTFKEIAELKEEQEFDKENIGKHRISIEKLWTSYGELKDQFNEHLHGEYRLREVLRELGGEVK